MTEIVNVIRKPDMTEAVDVTKKPDVTETADVTKKPETADVTKKPDVTETTDVIKKPIIIQKVRPQIKMTITQALGDGHPLVDGVPLKFTCKVFSDNYYRLDEFIDMKWTGVSIKKSLWVTEHPIKKERDHIERKLEFRPCLEYHAGDYTCHLTVRGKDGSTFTVEQTKQLKRKYHMLMNLTIIVTRPAKVNHVSTRKSLIFVFS